MSVLKDKTFGIIGAGNMAEALVRGVLNAGLIPAGRMQAADPSPERQAVFTEMGVACKADSEGAATCDIVLLSIKPQLFSEILPAVGARMGAGTLVISIAAGIRTEQMASLLPDGVRIVRVMPNTPMLVGKGVAGVAKGPNGTDDDLQIVLALMGSAADAIEVSEEMLDAVTALSGSGPAYLFRFVEALEAAGTEIGLPADVAARLARGTVVGAAALLDASEETPAVLRERVTSPGGTTAAALQSFTESGLESVVTRALQAARDRSIELSQG